MEPAPTTALEPVPRPGDVRDCTNNGSGKELKLHFERFCRDARLESQSASTTRSSWRSSAETHQLFYGVEQLYKFLYYRNPRRLQDTEATFFRMLPRTTDSVKARLELAKELLADLSVATPRKAPPKPVAPSATQSPSLSPRSPSSPTRTLNFGLPSFSSTVAAADEDGASPDTTPTHKRTVRHTPWTLVAAPTSPRPSRSWAASDGTSQAEWMQARAGRPIASADASVVDSSSLLGQRRSPHGSRTPDSTKRLKLDPPARLATPDNEESDLRASFPAPPTSPSQRFSPASGFARLQIPDSFKTLPCEYQWEAQRVLQAGIINAEQLDQRWSPRNLETLYGIVSASNVPFRRAFPADQPPSWEKVTLSAKLQYAKARSGCLFDMVLSAPKKGGDCALQRKFGNQNILYVDIPSLHKPPLEFKGKNLTGRFYDMAAAFQNFLGRQWFLYLAQARKTKKPETTKAGASRLLFVAVDQAFSMLDVLSYVIPYQENRHQAARKLYSRFELAASSTTPVLTFAHEDIQIVDDQLATPDPPHMAFVDPKFKSKFYEPRNSDRVMDDGCCEIHPWAMWQATLALGRSELQSALQARFGLGMAKGVWFRGRDVPFASLDKRPPGPLLKISQSQIKVKHGSLANLDSHALTLNVVKADSDVRPSILHIGFLPILVDRGVPTADILELAREQVQNDMDELESALKSPSPMPLRYWMHRRHELWEERNRTGGISTIAGFPVAREERIVQMLESGLVPTQEAFLASEIRIMVKAILDTKRKNYRVPLSRSTTLLGIADPTGCLAPGEIHCNFARPFRDKITGMVWPCLNNVECLIARNPAMAPWDMQKVRCIFRPELAHLPNLVILSVKGKQPLAGMLQGGDYDGDTFWLCWEPKLVRLFLNHPPPWNPPPVEFFGITKDTKTLHDYVKRETSEKEWLKWLADMALTRMKFNLLGVVTKLHERLIYLQGGIRSKEAILMVQLHDYLVDADKQGYDFSPADLDIFKQKIQLPTDLPTPAHWEFTKTDANNDEDHYPVHDHKITGNIIDDVYIKVIHPIAQASLNRVKDILRPADQAEDLCIAKFYNETIISAAKDDDMALSAGHVLAPREARDVIREELLALQNRLAEIRTFWGTQHKKFTFNELLLQLRAQYDSIMPVNTYHPTVVEWCRRQGSDLTTWEKLRASAFAKFHFKTNKRGRLIWHVAGRELCILKAHETPETRVLTTEAWCALRPRREPRAVDVDDEDDEISEALKDDDDDYLVGEYY